MSTTESVGGGDEFSNTVILDGLEAQGDARGTWAAVLFCIHKKLPFPEWVTLYLASTGANLLNHLDNRDERHPLNLLRALGFDRLNKPDGYDYDRDPEAVFERITTWLVGGEVTTISVAARRYHAEVLNEIGSPETVRELFYRGRRLSG